MAVTILQILIGIFFMFTGIKIISGKMAAEFERFGMPPMFNFLTGLIELTAAIGMVVGIWFPVLAVISGALLAGTMIVAAFVLIVVAKDPFTKAVPALVLCVFSVTISLLHLL
ncbi:DoxX family protein [Paenibacillus pasadenensis]|uniref:DoxX family protein n=1 Tax=Paenibacillus pasadenensis TaxID=217090 RepID=UPI002041F70F|nr:DoxX family protein [Paenibacillus pasadenensis]MCM3750278.1 DoxX family protein [Paenibacillus pasadenensis]